MLKVEDFKPTRPGSLRINDETYTEPDQENYSLTNNLKDY